MSTRYFLLTSVEGNKIFELPTKEVEKNELSLMTQKDGVDKLDVMTSKEFNRLWFINGFLFAVTCVHVLGIYLSCATIWKAPDLVAEGLCDETLTLKTCKPFAVYMIVIFLMDLAGRCFLILLLVVQKALKQGEPKTLYPATFIVIPNR